MIQVMVNGLVLRLEDRDEVYVGIEPNGIEGWHEGPFYARRDGKLLMALTGYYLDGDAKAMWAKADASEVVP